MKRPARRPAAATPRKAAPGPRPDPRVYLLRHAEVLLSSLGRLWRNPVASLMTVAVIGIALALPAGLHLLLEPDANDVRKLLEAQLDRLASK